MKFYRALVCLAFGLVSVASHSQVGSGGDVCKALLDHGLSNVVTYGSEYEYLTTMRDDFCGSTYSSLSSSKQTRFESAIKKVPLSFTGGRSSTSEQHAQFCSSTQRLQSGSGTSSFASRQLYDRAIDAWSDCTRLALGGIQVRPRILEDQKVVDFALSVPSGQVVFKGVETQSMSCRLDAILFRYGARALVDASDEATRRGGER
jgi:hypothetical protein